MINTSHLLTRQNDDEHVNGQTELIPTLPYIQQKPSENKNSETGFSSKKQLDFPDLTPPNKPHTE